MRLRLKKIITYLKEMKENRRQNKVTKFMFNNAFDSYDYFIGIDDDDDK